MITPRLESSFSRASHFIQKHSNSLYRATVSATGVSIAYNLFDLGLSKTLGLMTYYHATGPIGYVGINLFGADPNKGGGVNGSSLAADLLNEKTGDTLTYSEDSRNKFYAFTHDSSHNAAKVNTYLGSSDKCVPGLV